MQTVVELEQSYERAKQLSRRTERDGFRNPCFR
jgi:hypothetical protein